MNCKRSVWTISAVSALALALALGGCGRRSQDDHAGEGDKHAEHAGGKENAEGKEELTLTSEEAARAGIKTAEVRAEGLRDSLVVTATIRPDQDRMVRVSPRIEGRVVAAPAKLGDVVRGGQILATLDSVAVGEAHATWVQAQADLRSAEADFQRAESLNAEEIIPRKEFLRARAERDKTAAAVRNASDRLRLLGAGPQDSSSSVSSFRLVAPLSGVVIEKKATLGELATPAEPMFTIADLSRVWIQADLPEASLGKVQVGANARVSIPTYPNEVFSGRVTHIGAVLNKDTRTAPARIEVPNPDGRLKPEMFATATIEVGDKSKDAFIVPDEAIVLMQGQPSVFVYEQGAYEIRPVEPGDRLAGRTVIREGLKAGDQVVVAGTYALKARKLKSQLGHGH